MGNGIGCKSLKLAANHLARSLLYFLSSLIYTMFKPTNYYHRVLLYTQLTQLLHTVFTLSEVKSSELKEVVSFVSHSLSPSLYRYLFVSPAPSLNQFNFVFVSTSEGQTYLGNYTLWKTRQYTLPTYTITVRCHRITTTIKITPSGDWTLPNYTFRVQRRRSHPMATLEHWDEYRSLFLIIIQNIEYRGSTCGFDHPRFLKNWVI